MKFFRLTWRAVLAVALGIGLSGGAATAGDTVYSVPAVVNIHEGATVTDDQGNVTNMTAAQANAAIDRANKIMKQNGSGVQFKRVMTITGVKNPDGSGGYSSDPNYESFNEDQRQQAIKDAGQILHDYTQDKGIKIDFVKNPDDQQLWTGCAYHRTPKVFVKADPPNNDPGSIIVHETFHILTLDYHVIQPWDWPPPNDPWNRWFRESGANNRIMYPWDDGRTDFQLNQTEKSEIQWGASRLGKGEFKIPGTTVSVPSSGQRAAKSGPTAIQGPAYMSIQFAYVSSDGPLPDFTIELGLGGMVPTGGAGTYQLFINTDNNAATGISVWGHNGIDKIIRAVVSGPGAAQFFLDDPTAGSVPLTGSFAREPEFFCGGAPPLAPKAQDGCDWLLATVPKSLLGLSPGRYFDMLCLSGDTASPNDAFGMTLDMFADFAGPQLHADLGLVNPATDTLTLSGEGYTPNTMINLCLDNKVFDTAETDAAGQFIKEVNLPLGLPDVVYWLTADDPVTLDYGFAVINTVRNEWVAGGAGSYKNAANWTHTFVPNAVGATANFLAPSLPAFIQVPLGTVTLGTLNFDSPGSATSLTGPGHLMLQADEYQLSEINVLNGNLTIAVPVTLASDTSWNVAGSSHLTVSKTVSGDAFGLEKRGDGTLILSGSNTYGGGTTVASGVLVVCNTAGSGTGMGPVTVGAAMLDGTGFINGPVTLTGDSTLASTGTLTIYNTLTVQGPANQLSSGTVVTTDDVTIEPGAVFIINGTLGGNTSFLIVYGTLMGKGTIGKPIILEAGGTLSPGEPSTIHTMTQVVAAAPQTFSFEIGAASPNYANPSDSVNDVIRLTDEVAPFADVTGGAPAALTADTVIDAYFLWSDPAPGEYKAEFFADTDFSDAIADATVRYWRLDPRGSRYHNGNLYSPLDATLVDWSVVSETATFDGQAASGYITEFTVVPEPATLALVGFGLAGTLLRRKRGM
jgi:autotransporter-associated beta strand protein